MKAYKVFRKAAPKSPRSLVGGDIEIIYKTNKVNYPKKGTKLFCFRNKKSAIRYAKEFFSTEVWKIDVDELAFAPLKMVNRFISLPEFRSKVWENGNLSEDIEGASYEILPPDTYLCGELKLVQKVW